MIAVVLSLLRPGRTPLRLMAGAALLAVGLALGAQHAAAQDGSAAPTPSATSAAIDPASITVPYPEGMEAMDRRVVERIGDLARRIQAGEAPGATMGELAALYDACGLTDAALEAYLGAMRLEPEEPAWPHLRGALLGRLGRHEEAEAALLRAIALRPGSLASRERLGELYLAAGQPDTAYAIYRRLIDERPRDGMGYSGAGRALLAAGKPGEAVVLLELAVNHGAEDARTIRSLAEAYRGAGRSEAAERMARTVDGAPEASVADPYLRRVQDALAATMTPLDRARHLRGQGRLEEAAEALEGLLAQDPTDIEAMLQLALTHAQRGDHRRARGVLEQALAAREDVAATHVLMAKVLFNMGEAELMRHHAERATQLDAANVEARWLLGVALRMTGDLKGARAALERGVRVAPEDEMVISALAHLLVDQKEWEAALPHARWLADRRPNHLEYLRMLADVYQGLGRTQEAAAVWNSIAAIEGGARVVVQTEERIPGGLTPTVRRSVEAARAAAQRATPSPTPAGDAASAPPAAGGEAGAAPE